MNWNLPDGVNVEDIPGNSSQEIRLEAMRDRVEDAISPTVSSFVNAVLHFEEEFGGELDDLDCSIWDLVDVLKADHR